MHIKLLHYTTAQYYNLLLIGVVNLFAVRGGGARVGRPAPRGRHPRGRF